MSINLVMLTGNLTREPELTQTNGGAQILKIGLAVNERKKNAQTGQWEDKPNYVNCVMFGKRAAAVSPFLHKGTKISLAGRLSYSSWQDKQTGQTRSKLEVVIDDLELPQKQSSQGVQYVEPIPAPVQAAPVPAQTAPVAPPTQEAVAYDADIPF